MFLRIARIEAHRNTDILSLDDEAFSVVLGKQIALVSGCPEHPVQIELVSGNDANQTDEEVFG